MRKQGVRAHTLIPGISQSAESRLVSCPLCSFYPIEPFFSALWLTCPRMHGNNTGSLGPKEVLRLLWPCGPEMWTTTESVISSHRTHLTREDVCRAQAVVYFNIQLLELGSADKASEKRQPQPRESSLGDRTPPTINSQFLFPEASYFFTIPSDGWTTVVTEFFHFCVFTGALEHWFLFLYSCIHHRHLQPSQCSRLWGGFLLFLLWTVAKCLGAPEHCQLDLPGRAFQLLAETCF